MKYLFFAIVLLTGMTVFSQATKTSVFTTDGDIGNTKLKGSLHYDGKTNEYTIRGSGQNIWDRHDDFHFAWKKLKGDFILDAHVRFIGKGTNGHRKTGWMVRKSLEPNAVYADGTVHGDGLTSLQFRRATDTLTEEIKAVISAPDVIRFERRKNTYIFSAAKNGEPLHEIAKLDLVIGDEVYAGIFLSSHDDTISEEAVFSNVHITRPLKK
jgi:hypothetical protein